MKKISNAIWGAVLVLLGIIFALKIFNVVDVDIFFDGWWTLFIIIPAFAGLLLEREKIGNLFCLAIGVFLLLCSQGLIEFSWAWKIFVPAVIVVIGLKLLLAGVFGNKPDRMGRDMKKSGKAPKRVRAFFSSKEHELSEEWFDGAELIAVLGEVNYDLTKATIEKDCSIYAVAILGRVSITVPNSINVKVESNSVFGDVSNRTTDREDVPTLCVSGKCLFGKVEIDRQ